MGPLPLCRHLQASASGQHLPGHAISKLQQVSNVVQQVAALGHGGIVKSWAECSSFTRSLLKVVHSTKHPGLASGSYTKLWFTQSLLFPSCPADRPVQGVSVKEFTTAFPGAKHWLALLPKRFIRATMSACRYSASIVLFTLHLCTSGNKDMNFDLTQLQRRASDINQKRKCVAPEIHMLPTLASRCLAVLNNNRDMVH